MFKCKACISKDLLLAEKDTRIADLKLQLEDYKLLLSMPKASSVREPDEIQMEADQVLSGHEERPITSFEYDEELAERDRILAGTY